MLVQGFGMYVSWDGTHQVRPTFHYVGISQPKTRERERERGVGVMRVWEVGGGTPTSPLAIFFLGALIILRAI